jgi:hypothetical protein
MNRGRRRGPTRRPQRYTGTVSDDGGTISGAWEKCVDGATWERDFALTYSKLSSPRGPRLPHG